MSSLKSAIVAQMKTQAIQFLLNQETITLTDIDPNLTVLQFLREQERLTGTKEGCGSGDCGACTVVIAELVKPEFVKSDLNKSALNKTSGQKLSYQSINACITFIGKLQGKQLITVEHLKQGENLHPVQQTMVDYHASQCGFCTPGIVMSSFALHKNNPSPSRKQVTESLAGNLCRCTGYRSIIDASMQTTAKLAEDWFSQNIQSTIAQLTQLNQPSTPARKCSKQSYWAPKNTAELSKILLENKQSTLVAGGTDLALEVTQNLNHFNHLVYLGEVAELNRLIETEQQLIIGAAVPYTRLTSLLEKYYPELAQMIERIGSKQIRNSGTLGGNIGNASPIGDMPPALIALGSKMTLRRGNELRTIAIEDYFSGYKQTILAESEFIEAIFIDKPRPDQTLKVYKISKRFDDDISALLMAIFVEVDNNKIKQIRIAFGGMAAIPKRAMNCEAALINQELSQKQVLLAMQALSKDFQPLSDVRASADYRMKVAQNLLQRFYFEMTNKAIKTQVVDYA